MGTMGNKGLLNSKAIGLHLFIGVCSMVLFVGCLLLILQPLFADGLALNADAEQAGAWALLYRYGSIGVVGLWTACLLMPRKVVRQLPDIAAVVLMGGGDMGGSGGTEPTVWRRDVEPCTIPLHRDIPEPRTILWIHGDRGAAGGALFSEE